MIKKYSTCRSVEELTQYMDTLVSYVFHKLKKERKQKDIIYYPAYYLYRKDLDEFKDMNHLDEGYTALTITLRKINNSSSIIIVKLEGINTNDWRYDMLNTIYKKAIESIEKSINESTDKKGI